MWNITQHTHFFSGRDNVLFLLDPTRSKKSKGRARAQYLTNVDVVLNDTGEIDFLGT